MNWLIRVTVLAAIVTAYMAIAGVESSGYAGMQWMRSGRPNNLGAEYFKIAESVANGNGYGSPFASETGPTAWMPPVIPLLGAAALTFFDREVRSVAYAWLCAQGIACLCVGAIVICEAHRIGVIAYGFVIVILGFGGAFYELFQVTNDTAFVCLATLALWRLTLVRANASSKKVSSDCVWGFFGGFLAMMGPILVVLWVVCTVYAAAVRERRFRTPDYGAFGGERMRAIASDIALPLCLISAIILPWEVRTKVAIGNWVPIKSNAGYELWQSQVVDDNGVLDMATLRQHPLSGQNDQWREYQAVGEAEFVQRKREEAIEDIRKQPRKFLKRVGHRCIEALVVYGSFSDMSTRPDLFPLNAKRMLHAAPLLAIVVLFVLGHNHLENEQKLAICIFCLGMLPYLLVSYYERYGVHLLGVKMIIVVYACKRSADWWIRKEVSTSASISHCNAE